MIIRIKFTKEASVKYLGHLDIMRFFQKCFNRANILMSYSEGFNPHQKMSFAQPLGVGITSIGEYLDVHVVDGQDLEDIKNRMNETSGEGFKIIDVIKLEEGKEKCMSAVKYASYDAYVGQNMESAVKKILDLTEIVINKKTKSGIKAVDIRKHIFKLEAQNDKVSMLVSAGTENNVKPQYLLEEIFKADNKQFNEYDIEIVRTDLYGENCIPLNKL